VCEARGLLEIAVQDERVEIGPVGHTTVPNSSSTRTLGEGTVILGPVPVRFQVLGDSADHADPVRLYPQQRGKSQAQKTEAVSRRLPAVQATQALVAEEGRAQTWSSRVASARASRYAGRVGVGGNCRGRATYPVSSGVALSCGSVNSERCADVREVVSAGHVHPDCASRHG
jgi:hypothetical protein